MALYDPKMEDVSGWAKRRLEDSLKAITLDQIEAATPQTEPLMPEESIEGIIAQLAGALDLINHLVDDLCCYAMGEPEAPALGRAFAGAEGPQQPAKGLAALREGTSPQLAAGLVSWARGEGKNAGAPNWEDFTALGERIGADDPDAFAGWLQAIKTGTGKKRAGL